MKPASCRARVPMAMILMATSIGPLGCGVNAPPPNTVALNRAAPEGWELGGRDAATYRVDVDANEARRNVPSATLLSSQASPQQFALLAQEVEAVPYTKARVRFSGYLKSLDVQQRAFLWLRVDADSAIAVAFDDMHERSIQGTTRWKVCEVLLDVPADATIIRMGAGLIGNGQIWLSDCLLEIVDEEFASTDRQLPPVAKSEQAEDRFWEEALDLPAVGAESKANADAPSGS